MHSAQQESSGRTRPSALVADRDSCKLRPNAAASNTTHGAVAETPSSSERKVGVVLEENRAKASRPIENEPMAGVGQTSPTAASKDSEQKSVQGSPFAHLIETLSSDSSPEIESRTELLEGEASMKQDNGITVLSEEQSVATAVDVLNSTRQLASPIRDSPAQKKVQDIVTNGVVTNSIEASTSVTSAMEVPAVRTFPPILAKQGWARDSDAQLLLSVASSAQAVPKRASGDSLDSGQHGAATAGIQEEKQPSPMPGIAAVEEQPKIDVGAAAMVLTSADDLHPSAKAAPDGVLPPGALPALANASTALAGMALPSSSSSAMWPAGAIRVDRLASATPMGAESSPFGSWCSSVGSSAAVSWAPTSAEAPPSSFSSWSSAAGSGGGKALDSTKSVDWSVASGTPGGSAPPSAGVSGKWAMEALPKVEEGGSDKASDEADEEEEDDKENETEEEDDGEVVDVDMDAPTPKAVVVKREGEEVADKAMTDEAEPEALSGGGKVDVAKTESGSSDVEMPVCGGFEVKAIATGICQLFPDVKRPEVEMDCLIDIDVLAQHSQAGSTGAESKAEASGSAKPRCSIVEVCGRACPKGGSNSNARDERPGKRVKGMGRTNRLNNVCAFKMYLAGGGDKVTLRLWANGKTQTSGCKNVAMLREANQFISTAIIHIYRLSKIDSTIPPIFVPGADVAEAVLKSTEHVRILSAPILGSWDLNLRSTNSKLNMTQLCAFLSRPEYRDRVLAVKHVQPKGNSARFNNLSLYVRREALKSWAMDDNPDLASLYVNVYEAGKCSVLAAPDHTVAEELTKVVSGMLLEAYREDHIRLSCAVFPKKRSAAERDKERDKEGAPSRAVKPKLRQAPGPRKPKAAAKQPEPSAAMDELEPPRAPSPREPLPAPQPQQAQPQPSALPQAPQPALQAQLWAAMAGKPAASLGSLTSGFSLVGAAAASAGGSGAAAEAASVPMDLPALPIASLPPALSGSFPQLLHPGLMPQFAAHQAALDSVAATQAAQAALHFPGALAPAAHPQLFLLAPSLAPGLSFAAAPTDSLQLPQLQAIPAASLGLLLGLGGHPS